MPNKQRGKRLLIRNTENRYFDTGADCSEPSIRGTLRFRDPQHSSPLRGTPRPPRTQDDLMFTGDSWRSETQKSGTGPAASGLLGMLLLGHFAWPLPSGLDVYSVMADYIDHGQIILTPT